MNVCARVCMHVFVFANSQSKAVTWLCLVANDAQYSCCGVAEPGGGQDEVGGSGSGMVRWSEIWLVPFVLMNMMISRFDTF